MQEILEWFIAFLIVIPIAVVFNWLNKSVFAYKDKPEEKPKERKKEKWETDYYTTYEETDPERIKASSEAAAKRDEPKVYRGKRGGKFTRAKTKEGRPYRRYF